MKPKIAKPGARMAFVFTGFCLLAIAASLFAQEKPGTAVIRSEVKHYGTAEARAVTKGSGFFPDKQPEVYWHSNDWQVDLTSDSSPNHFSLKITSSDKRERVVKLPWDYSQIDSISQTPNNKAIVIANINGMTQAFCIIDLKLAKIIDGSLIYDPSISPNQRFILYDNWYPPHSQTLQYQYLLYDTLKTPDENKCSHWEIHPTYKGDDGGIQVYPAQFLCADEDDDDDNMAITDFIWSSDSTKVVFGDVDNGVISLILVTMPEDRAGRDNTDREDMNPHDTDRDRRHLPQTSIYTFAGANDVCAGAATCDNNNVRSVAWNGEAVNVALVQANPTGPAIVRNMTIPLSKFVPVPRGESSPPNQERH